MTKAIKGATWLCVAATFVGCNGSVADKGNADVSGGATSQGGQSTGGSALGGSSAGGARTAEGGTRSSTTSVTSAGGIASGGTRTQSAIGGTTSAITLTGGTSKGGTHTSPTGGTSKGGTRTSPTGGTSKGGTHTSPTGGSSSVPSSVGGTSTGGASTSTNTGNAWRLRKFVGNTTTLNNVDPSGLVFSKHWDQITPENEGKWPSVQASLRGAYNWSRLDAIYAYAQQNGLIFKEHSFIWGAGMFAGTITEADVKDWMTQFCTRYPKTALIDVVNEPPPHTTPNYVAAMGGGNGTTWQWITNAFKWARDACPDAVLLMNDYYNVEYSDSHAHFLSIVKTIQAAGAPIDALGVETHNLADSQAAFADVQSRMAALHNETGLPLYITEFDISIADDAKQLSYYQQYFPYFLNTDYIRGVTVWGWIDGATWVQNSGLVKNGVSRPAMTWLMETLGRPVP